MIGVKEGKVGINFKCFYDFVGLNFYWKFFFNYYKSRVIGNGIFKNRLMILRIVMIFDIFFKSMCVNMMNFNDY